MPSRDTGQRMAIAGTGVIASIGAGTSEFFDALCSGPPDPEAPLARIGDGFTHAFEIDDRPRSGDLPGRATRWLCDAVAEAVADAGIGEDLAEIPVIIGTGLRELRSVELRWTDGAEFPLSRLHFGPALRERFGAAATYTVNNACSASLYALGMGADLIASGVEDAVVVAGVDSITASMAGLVHRVQPAGVERIQPFDRRRRGTLLGEGAAAVVLRREAPAKAWLSGIAMNCDAHDVTAPDLSGISVAMSEAHARAGVRGGDVDIVVAHGTGTTLNDDTEAVALAKLIDGASPGPLVTAIKPMTGHTSGASGLMSLIVAVEALRNGLVPPICGLREPSEEAKGLRLVTGNPAEAGATAAQVDSFGFGGVNAVGDRGEGGPVKDVVVVGLGVASSKLGGPGDVLRAPAAPAAEFDPAALLGGRGLRYKDRATQLGMLAAARALRDASLWDDGLAVPGDSVGAVVSSNLGNLDTVCQAAELVANKSTTAVSPMALPNASSNIVASSIAVKFGLRGPNLMVCNGGSSGLDGVYFAARLIVSGRVRRAVAIGVEPVNHVVQKLAGRTPDELFDGAGAVVLESAAAAAERGAAPYARAGRYARRADLAGSVTHTLALSPPPGLWLVDGDAVAPAATREVPRQDVEAVLGAASGALGVLQIVAGVRWLGAGGRGSVLATAGEAADGVASFLLLQGGAV